MNASALLVDPLAALLRAELRGLPPLVLDETEIEVQLLAPLAHICTARRFTNSSDQLVEAVLTLPPLARGEVLHSLVIRIGGIAYEARPQSARSARRAHDKAVVQGRRAILYELLEHDTPMISIAGIEPGARVEILTWSIRPLARPEQDKARLVIYLSAERQASLFRLPDADAPITTPERHAASLIVSTSSLAVTISGQPYPDRLLSGGESIGVECSSSIVLDIVAHGGGSLDRSEWHVETPGGWEVCTSRQLETFRHPANPGGSIVSDRDDWIFGTMLTDAGEIRVTAPLPTEGMVRNAGGTRAIAPNARGMRAFAAVGFVEAANPQNRATVLFEANVLNRHTCLAFVGPDGDLPDEIPMLRKLALAEMQSSDFQREPPQPIAPEPYNYGTPAAPVPPLPIKEGNQVTPGSQMHTPGAKPPSYRWLTWAPMILVSVVIIAAFQSIYPPAIPTLVLFVGLMLLSAIRFLPREGSPTRRRLPLLLALPLPWILSLLCGPLVSKLATGEMAPVESWMIPVQYGLLAAGAALPLALIPIMRGARRFTLVLGILNLVLTFLVTAVNITILAPGS